MEGLQATVPVQGAYGPRGGSRAAPPVERRWLYVVLRGLPFGLGAAVSQFNRVPAVLTAAARRMLFIMCAHYVDDNGILELTGLRGDGPAAFQRLYRLAWVQLSA